MNKYYSGKLYIFEGIDGAGKTTVIREVCAVLKEKGISFSTYSFPGKEPNTLGALVYDFHHNQNKYIAQDINNASLQMLHVASHIDLLIRCIIPDLKKGKIVLLDRSWWSTFAYGIANGLSRRFIELIIAPELYTMNKIEIAKIFLLKRTQTTAEYDSATRRSILDAYDDLFAKHQRSGLVRVIYNNKSITEIASEIVGDIDLDTGKDHRMQTAMTFGYTETRGTTISIPENVYPPVFDTYWSFAKKRQDIFFSKLEKDNSPWTEDPILSKYKFTNAYRASDRVSQYLISKVIYNGIQVSPEDLVFRILIFKLFNKIETWEALRDNLGEITYNSYSFDKYDKVLKEQMDKNVKIYSGAYIMPSGKSSFHHPHKHQNNLALIELIMKDKLPMKIARVRTLQELYELLLQYPTFGKFLAFQLSIDINYSELCDYSEMSFVVAGPGAQSGIHKCFSSLGKYSYEDIIRYMADRQNDEFERLGLKFQSLWGRPLQLIDCQNLFCETDKYARVAFPNINDDAGRTRIKQIYKPSNEGPIKYFYPPKWNINQYIKSE